MRADSSSRSPARPGLQVFGRYQVIAKIGEGGAGQVFLARAKGEAGFERLFALKVIHWRSEQDRVGLTLQNEMRIASQVHHRNVVGILDFSSYSEGYYLVMEYVEGCTLSELQRRRGDVRPPRLIVPIIIDALYGLHAAHSIKDETGAPSQLVHRDVSPQNLLIGVDGACRVTDFGIAQARNLMRTTRPNVVRGKPAYMSPEQIVGGDLDQRSDVFSTGIVLWNALTGKKLFHGPSEHVSMFNVLKRKVPKPSTVGLQPPPYLDALVMKALEREPSRRFQTAEEMATAMRDAAMRAGELGAPTEIAHWVVSSFGPELEARRRTMREATEQAKVVRIDGDGTSLAAFGSVLPRLDGLGRGGITESVEHLLVEDLSLASDEVDDADATAMPADPDEPKTKKSRRARPKRSAPRWILALTGLVVVAAVAFLWLRPAEHAAEPAVKPAHTEEPRAVPALEVPHIEPARSVRPPTPPPPAAPEALVPDAGGHEPSEATVEPDTQEAPAAAKTIRRAVPVRAQRTAVAPPRRAEEPAVARPEAPAEPAPAPPPKEPKEPRDKADGRRLLETNPYLMK